MFRAHVLIIRRSELHYTVSGIITPIGGHLVHRLREDCALHETATYRCGDTRGCVMQFWPPGDEHMCLKYVQAWNKLIVKQNFYASSWLMTEINILRCTVSKTSKTVYEVEVPCVKTLLAHLSALIRNIMSFTKIYFVMKLGIGLFTKCCKATWVL